MGLCPNSASAFTPGLRLLYGSYIAIDQYNIVDLAGLDRFFHKQLLRCP